MEEATIVCAASLVESYMRSIADPTSPSNEILSQAFRKYKTMECCLDGTVTEIELLMREKRHTSGKVRSMCRSMMSALGHIRVGLRDLGDHVHGIPQISKQLISKVQSTQSKLNGHFSRLTDGLWERMKIMNSERESHQMEEKEAKKWVRRLIDQFKIHIKNLRTEMDDARVEVSRSMEEISNWMKSGFDPCVMSMADEIKKLKQENEELRLSLENRAKALAMGETMWKARKDEEDEDDTILLI
jgi:hypothetical protein